DHTRMMKLLGITRVRRGASGQGTTAYQEKNANPFTTIPDPLTLKNGEKVADAQTWTQRRRPEIVEDFDREIYGRAPKNTPAVKWDAATTNDGSTISKTLKGKVDNAGYPAISVNIEMTLVTPAEAKGPVPVIIKLGLGFGAASAVRGNAAQTWQQQLLAKGWG